MDPFALHKHNNILLQLSDQKSIPLSFHCFEHPSDVLFSMESLFWLITVCICYIAARAHVSVRVLHVFEGWILNWMRINVYGWRVWKYWERSRKNDAGTFESVLWSFHIYQKIKFCFQIVSDFYWGKKLGNMS